MDDEDDDLYNTSSRSKRQETKEPARVTDAQSNGNQSSLPAIVKEETLEDQDQDSDSVWKSSRDDGQLTLAVGH